MRGLLKRCGLLILIVLVAAFLRFFELNSLPPSLSWDEAAIGWNAKTIWQTRRDEFGTLLPLSFLSFGDHKSPVYIYLTAPIVGLFGLNAFTVRFLSALAGVLAVVVFYFLTAELMPKYRCLSLTAAAFLAVSPWHIMMSRPAFEPNLALLFVLLSLLFFFKGLKQKPYLWLSSLFFALSLYTYHSPKIFSVLMMVALLLVYRQKLLSGKLKKNALLVLSLTLILIAPLISDTLAGGGTRFSGTSIFFEQGQLKTINFSLIIELIKNYFVHFSPRFLFLGGKTIPRIQLQHQGLLLIVQAPFLLVGLWQLFKNRQKPWAQVIFAWLLIAPLPAMIGFEVPHPIRSYQLLPVLLIIIALGFVLIKKPLWQVVAGVLIFVNFGFFVYEYWVKYPIYSAPDWQYGYQQATKAAKVYENEVDKIVFTSYYSQPHIFTLFYQDRDPQSVFWGSMSKYLFRSINWEEDQNGIIENGRHLDKLLIIAAPSEVPANAKGLTEQINFPDGQPAFRIIKT